MNTYFQSENGILDLSEVKFSIQENNSKVSDSLFTKFTLPFSKNMNEEFIKMFGDYLSFSSSGLINKISGQFFHENKSHEAVLYLQNIQGYNCGMQIDYGLEDVPNFNKKLSELPLEDFKVPDIHTYAKTIAEKKYPATNFNFPRIYTTKYPTTDEVWKNFDGYINDLKKDGTEMRRNYIDEEGQIFNTNIIHPCPHILYLLKTGFADAGYQLEGDILTDPVLQKKWVYSGTEYFIRLVQKRLGLSVLMSDYDSLAFSTAVFLKTINIPKKGKYKVIGYIRTSDKIKGTNVAAISFGDSVIYRLNKSGMYETKEFFNIEINVTQENQPIIFKLYDNLDQTYAEPIIKVDIIPEDLTIEPEYTSEDLGVITNPNEINLKRAVPDMTFGTFVKTIKNWFNYDVDVQGKTVYMNRIADENTDEVQDLRFLKIPEHLVKRKLLNKKSYLLKFLDLDDNNKKDSMYYDIDGPRLNGEKKQDTNVIEINGYLMPLRLPKPQGYNTATVLKDSNSVVALVEYDGLKDGQNNATYSPGCDFPELFDSNWLKWLQQRINGQEYTWRKRCSIEDVSKINIKQLAYCYENIHVIKTINKDKISNTEYEIEITTETIV